ncbi:MAG: helix-turn-helix domain-containing protein [Actinomycetota bacterium]|nr:helix-turn-helix domain-containing protein [Actinomycetota bacterium]
MSIERAAEETKIRSDYLMRMESDDFDFLAPAYVRGFLRSYARFLEIDPAPLTGELESRHGSLKADTSSIAAMERRVSKAPKQRKQSGNWSLAAVLAASALLFLGVLGLLQGPQTDEPPGVSRNENQRDQGGGAQAEPQETPSSSPKPTPTETLASIEGVKLEIDTVHGECWIDVTSDGASVFSGTIPMGESRSFKASDKMTVVLGLPSSVELTVNGRNLGVPGDENPITIQLPGDIDTL